MELYIKLNKNGKVLFTKKNYNLVLHLDINKPKYDIFLTNLIRRRANLINFGTINSVSLYTFFNELTKCNINYYAAYENKKLSRFGILELVNSYKKNAIFMRNITNDIINTNELMVEYNRCLTINEILELERNYIYQVSIEFDILESINSGKKINEDPVFGYKKEYSMIKSTLKSTDSKMTDTKIAAIVESIENKINEFVHSKVTETVLFSYENNIFYCGELEIILNENVFRSLLWKLEQSNITNKNLQIFLILKMVLRYKSMVNLYTQWNLPAPFYNDLYVNGYNCECMSSPLNSQFLLLDYKNNVDKTVFCSIFEDTDKYFGSIGNFYKAPLDKYKNVVVCENNKQSYSNAYKHITTQNVTDYILVTIGKIYAPINYSINGYYLENNTLSHVRIDFKYYESLNIQARNKIEKLNLDMTELLKTTEEDAEYYELKIKLLKEWRRYVVVETIKKLGPTSGKQNYEWLNILERLLLSMATIKSKDIIFVEMDKNSNLYQTFKKELLSKKIENSEYIIEQVTDIIKKYFEKKLCFTTRFIWV